MKQEHTDWGARNLKGHVTWVREGRAQAEEFIANRRELGHTDALVTRTRTDWEQATAPF
jgi:hypothetical protein